MTKTLLIAALVVGTPLLGGGAIAASAASARMDDAALAPMPLVHGLGGIHRCIRSLSLSDEQHDRLREILKGRRGELRAAHDRTWAAYKAVGEAVRQDEVDEALIRRRVAEAATASADAAVLHAHVRAEMSAVLTPAQRERAERMHARFHDHVERLRAGLRAFFDKVL